jgi:hypothetical protein
VSNHQSARWDCRRAARAGRLMRMLMSTVIRSPIPIPTNFYYGQRQNRWDYRQTLSERGEWLGTWFNSFNWRASLICRLQIRAHSSVRSWRSRSICRRASSTERGAGSCAYGRAGVPASYKTRISGLTGAARRRWPMASRRTMRGMRPAS